MQSEDHMSSKTIRPGCGKILPAVAHHGWHHGQHEPHRQLLRQRLCRELLLNIEVGTRVPIGTMPHERKRNRTSSNTSRCSTIGRVGTRPSAMTPRPSTKRGLQSRNLVSTKLGEDQ